MAQIELLQIGCTGQQLIDTINALVAAHNEGVSGRGISYRDLADKPSLNGVELNGALTTQQLDIRIIDTADYDTYEAAWATKDYTDSKAEEAVAAAQAAVDAALDSKLDKDLSNIEATDTFPGDALVPVVTPSGIRKTTLRNVASYTEVTTNATRTVLSEAVKSQLKVLPITGEQNDSNVKFAVEDGFTTGTSVLYFNGQLLTAGKDYAEDGSYGIVMLTHIPAPSDVLVFMAVPLAFRKA